MTIDLWAPSFCPSEGGIQAYSNEVLMALQKLPCVSKVNPVARGKSRTAFGLRAAAQACVQKPELILCTHRNFAPLATAIKKIIPTRIAVSLHGVEAWNASPDVFREIDLLLPVSRFTASKLIADPSIPVEILPNTFDENRFAPGPRPKHLVEKYNLNDTHDILLTVGRLDQREAYKGQDRVIEALPAVLRQRPGCKYVVVGDGSDRSRLEHLARTLHVSDVVIFVGFVPTEELPDFYRLCDVFVMPSTGEGFGIAYLEALGCGKPVIAGNSDGARDPLRDGELGTLVDPGNIPELAAAILNALQAATNPQESTIRRNQAILHFGREAFRKQLDTILSRFLSCAG